MGAPTGFEWTRRKNGDVVITHGGRKATTLRGSTAADFIDDVAGSDAQELMARVTGNERRGNDWPGNDRRGNDRRGNDRRGNERRARDHPRNRGRRRR